MSWHQDHKERVKSRKVRKEEIQKLGRSQAGMQIHSRAGSCPLINSNHLAEELAEASPWRPSGCRLSSSGEGWSRGQHIHRVSEVEALVLTVRTQKVGWGLRIKVDFAECWRKTGKWIRAVLEPWLRTGFHGGNTQRGGDTWASFWKINRDQVTVLDKGSFQKRYGKGRL